MNKSNDESRGKTRRDMLKKLAYLSLPVFAFVFTGAKTKITGSEKELGSKLEPDPKPDGLDIEGTPSTEFGTTGNISSQCTTCSGTCYTACSGCGAGCSDTCKNGCKGNCVYGCTGDCSGTCSGRCTGCSSCTGSCTSCTGSCTGCTGSCYGCTGTCTGTCYGSCYGMY